MTEGRVIVVESVPEKVRVLFAVSVLPEAMVKVPVVEVIPRPLMEVADATPKVGVVKLGDVAKATEPEPVVAKFPATPALLYRMYPLVPPTTVVVPRVIAVPPPEPVAEIVIVPGPLVIVTFPPAVSVFSENPEPFPM